MIHKVRYMIADGFFPFRNMALEEYLLMNVQPGECILYLWQNKNTVVIGRNQNCWKECRVSELEKSGGYLARRLSGGGAVFHDTGNLNFTFIACKEDYNAALQTEVILRAVSSFGIKAEKSGRNDITADGRKFSGNAFYKAGGRCFHHGTILINADISMLTNYLNVSMDKLKSKGTDSVKSRVVNLCALNPDVTVDKMKKSLIGSFGALYGKTPEPINSEEINKTELERLTSKFADNDWRYGLPFVFTYEIYKRFNWGDIQIQLCVDKGRIADTAIYSDSLNAELISRIPAVLKGTFFSSELLSAALDKVIYEDVFENEMICDMKNLIKEQQF